MPRLNSSTEYLYVKYIRIKMLSRISANIRNGYVVVLARNRRPVTDHHRSQTFVLLASP